MSQVLTSKKIILFYGLLTAVIAISMSYLLLPPQLKLSYVLDDAHLAETEPQGWWGHMICPQCGSTLERIVIIEMEQQCCDFPWRDAYYCRQEDIFWVADCPGIVFAGWYGPFNAYWKLPKIVASSSIIISGVALVLLAMRDMPIHSPID